MSSLFRILAGLRTRLGRAVEDSLPMPAEERAERDWTGESSDDQAERRQERIRLQAKEKEGHGGLR